MAPGGTSNCRGPTRDQIPLDCRLEDRKTWLLVEEVDRKEGAKAFGDATCYIGWHKQVRVRRVELQLLIFSSRVLLPKTNGPLMLHFSTARAMELFYGCMVSAIAAPGDGSHTDSTSMPCRVLVGEYEGGKPGPAIGK